MSTELLFSTDQSLKLILKLAGNTCNIDCSYCFEKNKNVVGNIMTEEYLNNVLNKVNEPISITFHGGEPLIVGKNHMRDLLKVLRNNKRKVSSLKIQTNGVLLDDEFAEIFFEEYKDLEIEIAISLDGTESMNGLRVDYNGENTFNKVIKAFEVLDKWGKKAGMLSVISRNSLNKYKEYVELISNIKNLRFLKINALFNVENNHLTDDSILPTEFSEFIIEFAKIYIKNGVYKSIAVEPILSMLQKVNGKKSRYCNYNYSKCYEFITIYPDGLIGPCDCFSAQEFKIKDQSETLKESIIQSLKENNNEEIINLIYSCKNCEIYNFCTGGCISQRYYFRNNNMLSNNFCESKKMLFEFANKLKIKKEV